MFLILKFINAQSSLYALKLLTQNCSKLFWQSKTPKICYGRGRSRRTNDHVPVVLFAQQHLDFMHVFGPFARVNQLIIILLFYGRWPIGVGLTNVKEFDGVRLLFTFCFRVVFARRLIVLEQFAKIESRFKSYRSYRTILSLSNNYFFD